MYYVYLLCKPDATPFYVGKGKGDRIHQHEREARKGHMCHKCNTIRKVWRSGDEIYKIKVLLTDNEGVAFWVERTLIALYRSLDVRLCNLTDGGQGTSGVIPTAETIAKRRAMAESKEYRQKLSTGVRRALTRPEYRANLSASQRKLWTQSEHRKRITDALARPEVKEKLRNVAREKWNDPEYRQKHRDATNAAMQREDVREKHAAIMASQEYRDKHRAGISTPEYHEKKSVATKRIWQDEEQRKQRSEAIRATLKAQWQDPEFRAKRVAAIQAATKKNK
jgi:hypothetical protein